MRKKLIITFLSCLGLWTANAQETELTPVEKLEQRTKALESSVKNLQKLQVSGLIQVQYQYGQAAADGTNFKLSRPGGTNAYESDAFIPGTGEYKGLDGFSRFGIRRGFIKLTYTEGIASGVFQIDITEKGIGVKDAYLNIKDPWIGTCAFRAGIFFRPFGHEISYSSSLLESPERSRIIQTIFPDERDLGAMLILQGPKDTPWNMLKLEGGMFVGNGIRPQVDSRMDFIGHLSASKTFDSDMSLSGGVSLYLGGTRQMDSMVYVMKDNRFVPDSDNPGNIGKYAKRQYIGFDLQYAVKTPAGLTQLRGEYLFGEHAQNAAGSFDYKAAAIPAFTNSSPNPGTTYMRKISGGYVILAQDLGPLPFTAVVKYDWYDPNTEVSGNDIASKEALKEPADVPAAGTGASGDILRSNIGLGLIWRINNALKLTAYYDIVSNEKTNNIKDKTVSADDRRIVSYGYNNDRPDNVFTLRLQYKF